MTTELICDYCQKEIDEGAYHVAEQDPDDPAIVFNFHPDCYDLRLNDLAAAIGHLPGPMPLSEKVRAKIREEERGIDWDDIDPEERITDGDDD